MSFRHTGRIRHVSWSIDIGQEGKTQCSWTYTTQQPWTVIPGFWGLGVTPPLNPPHPEWCLPSHRSALPWGRSMALWGSWVFNWAFLKWGRGACLMRPGSCFFILTFRARLYRCPSSDLKAGHGLVALPQRCQTSASSSAACDIFTWMEYTRHIFFQRTLHTEPGVPTATWCPVAKWTGCSVTGGVGAARQLRHAHLSEVVRAGIFGSDKSVFDSEEKYKKEDFWVKLLKIGDRLPREMQSSEDAACWCCLSQ